MITTCWLLVTAALKQLKTGLCSKQSARPRAASTRLACNLLTSFSAPDEQLFNAHVAVVSIVAGRKVVIGRVEKVTRCKDI